MCVNVGENSWNQNLNTLEPDRPQHKGRPPYTTLVPSPSSILPPHSSLRAFYLPPYKVKKFGTCFIGVIIPVFKFLGVFAKLRKATISFLPIRPSGSRWTNFHEI